MTHDYLVNRPSDVLALRRAAEEEASHAANRMPMEELKTTDPVELGSKYFDDRVDYDKWFVDDPVVGKRVWVDAFEDAFRRNRRWREPTKTTLEGWL